MNRLHRPVRIVADSLLVLASVLGVLCALLALGGALLGFGVVLFRTGSMAPAIPAGSAALVRTVPAADIEVGDVVTVDRTGQLPVTHRVVSVSEVPGSDDLRELVLRGDANSSNDPLPYQVDSVRLVLASVPGVAPIISSWGRPIVLGPVTVIVAALVVAAFWPRRRRTGTQTASSVIESSDKGGSDDTDPLADDSVDIDSAGNDLAQDGRPEDSPAETAERSGPRHRRTSGPVAGAAVILLAAVGIGFGTPDRANAATTGTRVSAAGTQHLIVDSSETGTTGLMSPGDTRDWLITVRTAGVTGEVQRWIEVGTVNPAVTLQIDRCGTVSGDGCDPVEQLATAQVPSADSRIALPTQNAADTERLRVHAVFDADASRDVQGASTVLTFVAQGDGEVVQVQPPSQDDSGSPEDGTGSSNDDVSSDDSSAAGPATSSAGSSALALTGGHWWLLAILATALAGAGCVVVSVTRRDPQEEDPS